MTINEKNRLENKCNDAVVSIYGDSLPLLVCVRLQRELEFITTNNYTRVFTLATDIAEYVKRRGYRITTRGTTGSSLVAYLLGISNVNPLPPHYTCKSCHFTDFIDYNLLYPKEGYDYPKRLCPACGMIMDSYGADIPLEIIFEKNSFKPDIFLNVPSSIHKDIINYIKTLYCDEYQFVRAGTSIQKKDGSFFKGVHPGRVYLVNNNVILSDYTQLRDCAADDIFQMPITDTDYHDLDKMVKLDHITILSFPYLDVLCDLERITGVNLDGIDLSDRKILTLIRREYFSFVPDFYSYQKSNKIVKEVIDEVDPISFSDIVLILGLLSGVNTWFNNGEKSVNMGIKSECLISCRDDIFQELNCLGVDSQKAIAIMKRITQGKGLSDAEESIMKKAGVSSWYIDSCRKIKYLFPKAQLVEYAIMYCRLAYYKAYFPEIFLDVTQKYTKSEE